MTIGDYVNVSGTIGILVDEPINEIVNIFMNGTVIGVHESELRPLTDLQKRAIELYHKAIVYGYVDKLEEHLQSLQGSANK